MSPAILRAIVLQSILRRALLFIALFGLGVLVYRNGLHIPYYNDDYQRVFTNPPEALLQGFIKANPIDGFYRPLEQMVLASIQSIWGWDTLPIRLINVLLHSIAAMLVFHALRTWKVNQVASIGASVFLIVSQLSVYAVASNNTFSQLSGTLFSALSLWFLYRHQISTQERRNRWKYLCSIMFFFLALMSKETSTYLVVAIPFLILALNDWHFYILISRKNIAYLFPFAIVFIIYGLLRMNSGGTVPSFSTHGYYQFVLGENIFRNIKLFGVQAFLPVSTVRTLQAIIQKDTLQLVAIMGFTTLLAITITYGLWKSSRRRIIILLCALIFFSWLPMVLLNRITECYAYGMIIFLSIIFGFAIEFYWGKIQTRLTLLPIAACVFLFAAWIINEIGANEKVILMKREGDCAEIFLPQIINYARTVPEKSWMYFVQRNDNDFSVSRYISTGFQVVDHADTLIRYFANRPDIGFFYGIRKDCLITAQKHPGIAFIYNDKTLQISVADEHFGLIHR